MRAVSQHWALVIEGKTVDGEATEEKVVDDTLAVEDKSGSAAVSYWQRHGEQGSLAAK